jgi:hypothetical protein
MREGKPKHRVAQEHAAVHLADVDPAHGAAGQRVGRGGEVERDAQVLGQLVHRAERQDAQRRLRAGEEPGRGRDRPVAAAHDHRVGAGRARLLQPADQVALLVAHDHGVEAGRLQVPGDLVRRPLPAQQAAGVAVDDDGDAHLAGAAPARRL